MKGSILILLITSSYSVFAQSKKEQINELISSVDSCKQTNAKLEKEIENVTTEKIELLSNLTDAQNELRINESKLKNQKIIIDSLTKISDFNVNLGKGIHQFKYGNCNGEHLECVLEIKQLTKNSFSLRFPDLSSEDCACTRRIFELERIGQVMKIVKVYSDYGGGEYELEYTEEDQLEDIKFIFQANEGKLSAIYVVNKNVICCEIWQGGYYPLNEN